MFNLLILSTEDGKTGEQRGRTILDAEDLGTT